MKHRPAWTTRERRLYDAMLGLDQIVGLISRAQENLFLLDRDKGRVEGLIAAKQAIKLAACRAAQELEAERYDVDTELPARSNA